MLAKDNPSIDQAVSSVWYLSEDKKIRDEIWKREDNELIYRSYMIIKEENERTSKENEKTQKELARQRLEFAQSQEESKKQLKEKDDEIAMLLKEIETLKKSTPIS